MQAIARQYDDSGEKEQAISLRRGPLLLLTLCLAFFALARVDTVDKLERVKPAESFLYLRGALID